MRYRMQPNHLRRLRGITVTTSIAGPCGCANTKLTTVGDCCRDEFLGSQAVLYKCTLQNWCFWRPPRPTSSGAPDLSPLPLSLEKRTLEVLGATSRVRMSHAKQGIPWIMWFSYGFPTFFQWFCNGFRASRICFDQESTGISPTTG